ncbi:MAG TPA: response regulator [Phycisphaerales bacterium]|nr:response regulator [Phycisphaerales bacterium]
MSDSTPNPTRAQPLQADGMQPAHMPLVLIIEDEEPIRRFLRATLEANHYRVKEAGTAREGTLLAVTTYPDVVLLDLGLPDGDGLNVTRAIRKESRTPIVVLSARGQESDKVAALDAGADDYLTKPFGVGELLARLRVALRHANSATSRGPAGSAEVPPYESTADRRTLRVDLAARLVFVTDQSSDLESPGRREVRLTPMEFKLLAFLVKHAGKVLTHQMILKEVWGPQHASDVQYLRVYAGELRKKLEVNPAQPRFIVTEPGVGYRLAESTVSFAGTVSRL